MVRIGILLWPYDHCDRIRDRLTTAGIIDFAPDHPWMVPRQGTDTEQPFSRTVHFEGGGKLPFWEQLILHYFTHGYFFG
jgi:hypothetical protein